MRIRVLLHALDRTGPPMLALTFARWLATFRPEHQVEWVSFRGGPLLDEVVDLGPTTVLLDPNAGWEHTDPPPQELHALLQRARSVGPADVMLAVSVAAGQVLPYLPSPAPPLVTWSVERGEDLHWLNGSIDLRDRTMTWLAGSVGTQQELSGLLGHGAEVLSSPEFVEDVRIDPLRCEQRRSVLGAPEPPGLLVLGAGIATTRKAPDLFLELALAAARRHGSLDRFVWLGGQDDPMFHALLDEVRRLGLDHLRFLGNVGDVAPWLAAADVLAHPARLDSFPLVALHAGLGATPVIGFTDTGGLSEMFDINMLGAPYPDVPALLDVLDTLRDARIRRDRAARQRSALVQRFTVDVGAPILLSHLERAAEHAGPTCP